MARMLCRAATNTGYEGWPWPRLIISLLACRATRPGISIIPKRTAFSRLLTHSLPKANYFIAEFKLKASTVMAHHAALAPNSPEGSRPPGLP